MIENDAFAQTFAQQALIDELTALIRKHGLDQVLSALGSARYKIRLDNEAVCLDWHKDCLYTRAVWKP